MKSNKEIIFEYLQSKSLDSDLGYEYITTTEISNTLDMQRSNVSSILNQLYKDNRIDRKEGRPVRYSYIKKGVFHNEVSVFNHLIGANTTLVNEIKLAKASILYPGQSLPIFIIGPNGSGKSFFSRTMYDFAVEKGRIAKKAPFVVINCRNYNDQEELHQRVLGSSEKDSAILEAKDGVLVIDHFDFLSSETRNIIFEKISDSNSSLRDVILICSTNDSIDRSLHNLFYSKFPVKIVLPSIIEKSFSDRLELISAFFKNEAKEVQKNIKLNAELLRCILLYKPDSNIKQLKTDIKLGCANAFVREFGVDSADLHVYINDFPSYVRKGFLFYKENKKEIENLIPPNYSYTFSTDDVTITRDINFKKNRNDNIYAVIEEKIKRMRINGIDDSEISAIINSDLEKDFLDYKKNFINDDFDRTSIIKIVNEDIVTLVEAFLSNASLVLHRVFSKSVFYGLCLHLSNSLSATTHEEPKFNSNLHVLKESHSDEFALSQQFIDKIDKELSIKLNDDELVFITMFISSKESNVEERPVVLIATHGDSTASSIVDVVDELVPDSGAFAYNLMLNLDMHEAYDELRNLILRIDRGKGILFLYDMGSLETMIESISQETGIAIKSIQIPATLMAIDAVRQAKLADSVEELHTHLRESSVNYFNNLVTYERRKKPEKVIITLCMSGHGGAEQIKKYLEENLIMKDTHIVPLAVNDRKKLLNTVNELQAEHEVLYVIGTYDPKIYGIPYIAISKVFETPKDKLSLLLVSDEFEVTNKFDYSVIYEYLSEQIEHFDIPLLKSTLPVAMDNIRKLSNDFSLDQELGLFLHIASNISRLVDNIEIPNLSDSSILLNKNKKLYAELVMILKDIEESFEIKFKDNDYANIIGIIKKV